MDGFEESTIEIDHPYMFTSNTLPALVQKAGLEIVRCELCRQPVRRRPQAVHLTRIHVFGRKSTEPDVEWPQYATERAALDGARVEHAARVERKREILRKRRAGQAAGEPAQ